MDSRLTRSSAGMGALKPALEILETPETLDNTLDLTEDQLQEDACETSCAPGKAQPAATDNEDLALQTRLAQLERDLAVTHNRTRDLIEINSLLRHTASNPAPARASDNAEPPPPPDSPPLPDTCQSSMPPPGNARLSSPALVTCLGESLPAGVALNKYYTDARVFDGWMASCTRTGSMQSFASSR